MAKKLMWMAVTPDRFENIMFIEDTAEALADVMGLKPQTIRRQKWYLEHKAKDNNKGRKAKYKIITMPEEEVV